MRSPLDTLHIPIVLSSDPEAKYSPSGENTTLHTEEEWPVRVLMCSPLDTLYIPTVPSEDPEAKYSPFGEKATLKTYAKVPIYIEVSTLGCLSKYTLSGALPKLSSPLKNSLSFLSPLTSSSLNISSSFSFSSFKSLINSSLHSFSISCIY